MSYGTLGLSYLFGQDIYVVFLIFHIVKVSGFHFLYSNVLVFLTSSEVLEILA